VSSCGAWAVARSRSRFRPPSSRTPEDRLEPKPCAGAADCGPNFECTPEGACARHRCVSTTHCEGYCVNGLCYDAPGECGYPLP